MSIWNVCLAHSQKFAGLHRAVEDFAAACDGPILSFDPTVDEDVYDPTHQRYVLCSKSWLRNGPHYLPTAVSRKARELLSGADGAVVHSLFRAHCKFVADWATDTRRPFWCVPHGCLDPWGLSNRAVAKKLWLKTVGSHVFRRCQGVFFSASNEKKKAERWIGKARSIVTHWPVDLPRRDGWQAQRNLFRKQYDIAADDRVLLFVGRLHSMKRPTELIEVFAAAGIDRCHLILVGMDGDLSAVALRNHITRLGVRNITVAGPLYGDDLISSMAAADGYVSLSYRENFSYAAADAVAAGLPVLLSEGHDLVADLPLLGTNPGSCGWLLEGDVLSAARQALEAFSRADSIVLKGMSDVAGSWAADNLKRSVFYEQLRREVGLG